MESDAGSVPVERQSFTAGFELQGNSEQGNMTLFTPLGGTAAEISWTPALAVMQAQGEAHNFASIDLLISKAVGTDIPLPALFGWLNGRSTESTGWNVDLSQFESGKIVARRVTLGPAAEIRVVLEK